MDLDADHIALTRVSKEGRLLGTWRLDLEKGNDAVQQAARTVSAMAASHCIPIREFVAGLRNDQAIHEERRLRNGSGAVDRAIALRLAALYNWAKATETLAGYMLQGEPGDPFGPLDKHFEAGIRAAPHRGTRSTRWCSGGCTRRRGSW